MSTTTTTTTTTIRRTAAIAAAAALTVGLTACEPEQPFFPTRATTGYQVSNGYRPVAGDFDGDGFDDLIFLEPDRWDALWEGRADGHFVHLAAPAQLDGWHTGIVGDFGGDATDDVLWARGDGEPSPLWVMQAGGGLAETRSVTLPADAGLATIDEATGHDLLLVDDDGSLAVWDPDTDVLDPLATGAGGAPGDFDGDGHADVFLHRPGSAADQIAWGDGDGTFTVTPTTNIGGSYQVIVLDADGDDRDDLVFSDETVGHQWAMNLWFSEGRTFRRVAYTPMANRGIYQVHHSHVGGPDTLVKYSNSGAQPWTVGADGKGHEGPTTRLNGPGTVPVHVGRFHDGVADDAFVYDDFGDHPQEALLATAPASTP